MRRGILGEREAALRAREGELLDRLARTIDGFAGAGPDDARRLAQARESLDGFFLLVVAGEFNSGKSSVINALLGERVLPEGVTPTTDRLNVLRHGSAVAERPLGPGLVERTHPAPLLRELNVVDTPGTNAVIREHEALTRDFVPRSDLILFATSADRPFTESERAFLAEIRDWGKKIVLLVNKADILDTPAERAEVEEFVRARATALLGSAPVVLPVSARAALAARQAGDADGWAASGFGALDDLLLRTLDAEERVRLKLLNPLLVAARVAAGAREAAYERLRVLAEDVAAIAAIDARLADHHAELLRDLEPRLAVVDGILRDLEARGLAFLDDHVRVARIRGLASRDELRRAFELEVVGDTQERIDEEVGRVIDWLVERNLRVWQDVDASLDRRRLARHGEALGETGRAFAYNREALLGSVGRLARSTVASYDREAEARAFAAEVQGAFARTALAEVGAVGLGALTVAALGGAFLDVTGILLAVTLAVGGLYVVPARRRRAKAELARKVEALRARLHDALERQLQVEAAGAAERIAEAVGPYRRFVESEQRALAAARDELVVIEDALRRLRDEIEPA